MALSSTNERVICLKQSKRIAACGMMAALSVVIMLLGGVLGIGMYASPMLAGFCLLPIGKKYGAKNQWLVWAAVSLLCFMLIPEPEQNLMYLALFGLYPILYPYFVRLPGAWKWISKLLYFHAAAISVELLVMLVLVPEVMSAAMIVILLILGNAVFWMYDFLIPRSDLLFQRFLGRRFRQ